MAQERLAPTTEKYGLVQIDLRVDPEPEIGVANGVTQVKSN